METNKPKYYIGDIVMVDSIYRRVNDWSYVDDEGVEFKPFPEYRGEILDVREKGYMRRHYEYLVKNCTVENDERWVEEKHILYNFSRKIKFHKQSNLKNSITEFGELLKKALQNSKNGD